jgi:deferrochelatase/peroxidase EfeB
LSSDHDFRDGAAATAPASRRSFMRGAGGLAAAGMVCPFSGARAASETVAKGITPGTQGQTRAAMEGFDGPHQSGILTPLQNHSCFVVFDLVSEDGPSLVRLMRLWTEASRRMMRGQTAAAMEGDPDKPGADSGEAIGLGPSRLSITFGFGAGVFEKDGKDRYGLRSRRPAALIDLPRFNGDQLAPAITGGDLSVQACADDPQVAFHAVRQLARIADGVAQLRWIQNGYNAQFAAEDTPRNLMGFKDGTQNPIAGKPGQPQAIAGGKPYLPGSARALGPHRGLVPGGGVRPQESLRRAPDRQGRVRPARSRCGRPGRQSGDRREQPCPARLRRLQRRRADPQTRLLL